MIKAFLYILIGAFFTSLQQDQKPEKEFPLKNLDFFTIDQFQNIYHTRFDQLRKLDKSGKNIFEYSNPLLGAIHSVSALDPLSLLIFYKDQAQITTLDNRLNESTAIRLTDIGLNDVQLISQSDQNNVWVYDQATDRLYRINIANAAISNKSLNITQLANTENQPAQLESTYDHVFLNLPESGILLFDATGALMQTIALKSVSHFSVLGENLFYLKNDTIRGLNLKKNTLLKSSWPAPGAISFTAVAGRIYVLDKKKLCVYSLSL
ncbi:MAG: hypothetical protein RLP14_04360 [Owenweeksia sp.]